MRFGTLSFSRYKLKGLIMMAVGLSVLLALIVLICFSLVAAQKPARLELYIGEEKRSFEGKTVSGMTILEAMYASSLAGQISFKYTVDPLKDRTVILSLNGYSVEEKTKIPHLSFYLNHQKVETDKIHVIPIKPGDLVVIKEE